MVLHDKTKRMTEGNKQQFQGHADLEATKKREKNKHTKAQNRHRRAVAPRKLKTKISSKDGYLKKVNDLHLITIRIIKSG